jgi:DNA repair ATPase RecN
MYDTLLINLKLLSKIKKNDKIVKSADGIISIDSFGYIQPIKRLLNGDSRTKSLVEVSSILEELENSLRTITTSQVLYKSNALSRDYHNACILLYSMIHESNQAKIGIENLKVTYASDNNTVAKIEVALQKLEYIINDYNSKYQEFICAMEPVADCNDTKNKLD